MSHKLFSWTKYQIKSPIPTCLCLGMKLPRTRGHQLVDGDGHWGALGAFRESVLWEAVGFQSSQSSLSMLLLHMILLKGLWWVNSLFSSCKNLWYVPISILWSVTLTFGQIPLTNPYPGPRSVLILDNCHIHHAEEICELVEDEAGMFTV